MHPDIQTYYSDVRSFAFSKPILHVSAQCPDTIAFYLATKDLVLESGWHWLGYLYNLPWADANMWRFANLCVRAERRLQGLGIHYIKELAHLGGPERDECRYEQMLQLFAEVFAIDRVLVMPWGDEAQFYFEPRGANGLRPDFRVVDKDGAYNFEVKSPSLLAHQRLRAAASVQLPVRITKEFKTSVQMNNPDALLPRDNPVKDFLVSADAKFSGFPRNSGANILVIVWDDFIYELFGSLLSDFAGLLTNNSFFRSGDKAVIFENVDAVICVRHMNVFQEALAERPLPDNRTDMFELSRNPFTPNVFIPTPWGNACPQFILESFGALMHDDERLQTIAEYRMPEYIFYV
ncbi:MAG: hypothetical protein K0U50_04895 [Alphaproteobacteria bacterium]|nr:hypothetical protein [Alphaproteobacteria bacterium]